MIQDAEAPLNEPEPEGTENASDSAAAGPESDEESIAAGATDSTNEDDSITFSRCASCRHAEELDRAAGTLLCAKHDMRINAEADEIPDDCPDYDPAEPS